MNPPAEAEIHENFPSQPAFTPDLHLIDAHNEPEATFGTLPVGETGYQVPRTEENELLFVSDKQGIGYEVVQVARDLVRSALITHEEMKDLRPPDAPERLFSLIDTQANSFNNARLVGMATQRETAGYSPAFKDCAEFEIFDSQGNIEVIKRSISQIYSIGYTAVKDPPELTTWRKPTDQEFPSS